MYHKKVESDDDYKGRPVASNVNNVNAKKHFAIFNSFTLPEGKPVSNGTEFSNLVSGTKIRINLTNLVVIHPKMRQSSKMGKISAVVSEI